jgi:uncharacterized protein (TIGR02646 family)
MRPCTRGPEPELLARYGPELGREYAERRRSNRTARFEWRQREGRSLLEVVREALALMTDDHCSYCDGHPIDATGEKLVDHFRPKAHPDFYALAYAWTNLFLVCSGCNRAKAEQWDEALLRPDDADYAFERYFEYRFDTGELHPSTLATPLDQERARRTIEILKLNRSGNCKIRQDVVKRLRRNGEALGYRYLIPLCSPTA